MLFRSGVPVRRPVITETTSLGAALLAGLAIGFWKDLGKIEEKWLLDWEALPDPSSAGRVAMMKLDWKRAVERSLDWAHGEGCD